MAGLQFTCCKLCSCIYKDARLLPCLHSFCYDCLDKYLDEYILENRVICPCCRDTSILPADGVDGLPKNSVLMRCLYVQGLELSPSTRKLSLASNECESRPVPKQVDIGQSDTMTPIPNKITPATSNELDNHVIQETDLLQELVSVDSERSEMAESTRFDSNASTHAISISDSGVTASDFSNDHVKSFESDTEGTKADGIYLQCTDTLQPDFVTTKKAPRESMQITQSVLHEEALSIVSGIDKVNEIATEWLKHKAKLKSKIQQRAKQLQEILVLWEKKLICRLDNFRSESEFQKEVYRVKGDLHNYLGDMLNVSEFIRILLQYGTNYEMGEYDELIKNKLNKISEQKTKINQKYFVFDYPREALTEPIEDVFGILTTKEQPVFQWAPRLISGTDNQEHSCLNTADMFLHDELHQSSFKTDAKHFGIDVGSKQNYSKNQSLDSNDDVGKQVKMQEFLKAKESLSLRRKHLLKKSDYAKQKPFLKRETIECYPSFLLKRSDSEESDELPVFDSLTRLEDESGKSTNSARSTEQTNGNDNVSLPAVSTPRKQKLIKKSSSVQTEFPSSFDHSDESFNLEDIDTIGENCSPFKIISDRDHLPVVSSEYLNITAQSEPVRNVSEDLTQSEMKNIEHTKRSLALHKKQLLGAVTGENKTSSEVPCISRFQFRQMREGMREKSYRWRSLSASEQY